jgi:hypothetical protein
MENRDEKLWLGRQATCKIQRKCDKLCCSKYFLMGNLVFNRQKQ